MAWLYVRPEYPIVNEKWKSFLCTINFCIKLLLIFGWSILGYNWAYIYKSFSWRGVGFCLEYMLIAKEEQRPLQLECFNWVSFRDRLLFKLKYTFPKSSQEHYLTKCIYPLPPCWVHGHCCEACSAHSLQLHIHQIPEMRQCSCLQTPLNMCQETCARQSLGVELGQALNAASELPYIPTLVQLEQKWVAGASCMSTHLDMAQGQCRHAFVYSKAVVSNVACRPYAAQRARLFGPQMLASLAPGEEQWCWNPNSMQLFPAVAGHPGCQASSCWVPD